MSVCKKALSLLVCLSLVAGLAGCGKAFDAEGYVRAILHLTFQGDTTEAKQMTEGATEESLRYLYQSSIDTFTYNVLTSQFENISEARELDYAELVAKIFSAMRYSVKDSEKTGRHEYEVAVEIQPADVFETFGKLLEEDGKKLAEEVKAGKYEGTEEEIHAQIMGAIVGRSYGLLDVAYSQITYGDSETVTLRVSKSDDGEYSINEDDMNHLIEKILRLDEM